MIFSQDASGRPCLNFGEVRPASVLDALKSRFGVVVHGKPVEDALGDSWVLPISVDGEPLELDWDHSFGLSLRGSGVGSAAVLARIHQHFIASPPARNT